MPTVLISGPYRFHFYAGDRTEPRHVYVERDDDVAKVWLDPDPQLSSNHGFSGREIRRILTIVRDNIDHLRGEWDEFFA